MRETRCELRDRFPDDPGWLAYVVYGHPNAAYVPVDAGEAPVVEEDVPGNVPGPRGDATERPPARAVDRSTGSAPDAAGPRRGTAAPARDAPAIVTARGKLNARDGAQLVHVPAGDYMLGAEDLNDAARPVHRVRLSAYYIGLHPVTNEQYARFLARNPDHPPPAYWDDERFNGPRHPVVGVSWSDAEAYCRWAGLGLPSEAQWEAAARGTDQRRFPWGDDDPTPLHANYDGNVGRTTPVDAYPAGRGPFGTFDQAGNVWEWCADLWSPTAYHERGDGRLDPCHRQGTGMRVLRGGSWLNPRPDLHAACRDRATARLRQNMQGFRCVTPA